MTPPPPSEDPGTPDDLGGDVWKALRSDPSIGVCVIDESGVILSANERIATLFLESTPDQIVGRSLHELYPRDWAEERLQLFESIARTGKPAILRHIRRGQQLQSTIRQMQTPAGQARRFLTITHVGETFADDERDHFEVVESELADFGTLDALSNRQIEVLAFLKMGLTPEQIGDLAHRPAAEVEADRAEILKTLGLSSPEALVRIAQRAGLELSDARLKRTHEPTDPN